MQGTTIVVKSKNSLRRSNYYIRDITANNEMLVTVHSYDDDGHYLYDMSNNNLHIYIDDFRRNMDCLSNTFRDLVTIFQYIDIDTKIDYKNIKWRGPK